MRARQLGLVEAGGPAVLERRRRARRRVPSSSRAELRLDVLEELGEVHLAHQDAPLAARELEHLALHRADEVELLQDEPRVLGALRRVGRRRS